MAVSYNFPNSTENFYNFIYSKKLVTRWVGSNGGYEQMLIQFAIFSLHKTVFSIVNHPHHLPSAFPP